VPTGEAYPGFQGPYASRVRRIDACFGTFVDFLKRRGLYDKSIIILTSDHGEMLGENGEWGHVYYLSPEVLRIPLIMRLPPSMAAKLGVDLNAVAFSTDITPTLYAALGYEPHRTTWLMGEPLIAVPGADFSERRRRTEVVAASYGPVWGALAQNGRQLYVIDTIKGREQAYELTPNAGSIAVPVTAGLREASQRAIREHIDEINRVYQVNGTD
jgi:arylsulfatase A-like enzyme